jgi:hypothetical protein
VDENGEEGFLDGSWWEMEKEKARRKKGRGREEERGVKKKKTKRVGLNRPVIWQAGPWRMSPFRA